METNGKIGVGEDEAPLYVPPSCFETSEIIWLASELGFACLMADIARPRGCWTMSLVLRKSARVVWSWKLEMKDMMKMQNLCLRGKSDEGERVEGEPHIMWCIFNLHQIALTSSPEGARFDAVTLGITIAGCLHGPSGKDRVIRVDIIFSSVLLNMFVVG